MAIEPITVRFAPAVDEALGFVHPVRIGVPFAEGALRDADQIAIEVSGDQLSHVQTRVLHRWPDGSVKWCLLQWLQPPLATKDAGVARIVSRDPNAASVAVSSLQVDGKSTWEVAASKGGDAPLRWLTGRGAIGVRSRLLTADGGEFWGHGDALDTCEIGPVVSRNVAQWVQRDSSGASLPLETKVSIEHFEQISAAIFRVTIRNPQPATHPGGNWDLGNGGSIFLKDWTIEFSLPERFANASVTAVCEPGVSPPAGESLKLFQASSGGENWLSRNHVDKDRRVRLPFRGYRLEVDGRSRERSDRRTVGGLRATPQVIVAGDQATFALAMRRFWENFPKAIEVTNRTVRLSLFPADSGYPHEIQGGEQKTHEFAVYFGDPTDHAPLDWYSHPVQPQLDPEYYATTGAIPYLTPRVGDPNQAHHALVDAAIEGNDTFVAKRERIDEYGWRNFGDIYGDHEAVYHDGPTPLISHYNNQYDCTGGFAWQFFRTGDFRWFDQMIASADHVWDIDTYHTDGDKSLYNHGLFWHTYHYADADTANHRSYPRRLTRSHLMPGGKDLKNLGSTGETLAKNYAVGGGPSASQNYSTGWMWAYFLTGQQDYRDAAISAADYVIAVEQGSRTIFRWLSRADTGYASESSVGYHGPGRASGNSLHALLTGYELTDDNSYLMAAEKLIRRVAHPAENIDSLDLGNAELRWFYTMYLQALTRYLDVKREHRQNDESHAYAIATLNHFADWMAENERPTLDQAERLQYPTETWVAQDMRKWHVLQYAAWLNGDDPERAKRFQEKADFFFDYACQTLHRMPTRTLCRPVVLMMQFGWQREWFRRNPQPPVKLPEHLFAHFPPRESFTPQRTIAIRRAKLLLVASAIGFATVSIGGLMLLLNR
jgi:hypothetical protein